MPLLSSRRLVGGVGGPRRRSGSGALLRGSDAGRRARPSYDSPTGLAHVHYSHLGDQVSVNVNPMIMSTPQSSDTTCRQRSSIATCHRSAPSRWTISVAPPTSASFNADSHDTARRRFHADSHGTSPPQIPRRFSRHEPAADSAQILTARASRRFSAEAKARIAGGHAARASCGLWRRCSGDPEGAVTHDNHPAPPGQAEKSAADDYCDVGGLVQPAAITRIDRPRGLSAPHLDLRPSVFNLHPIRRSVSEARTRIDV